MYDKKNPFSIDTNRYSYGHSHLHNFDLSRIWIAFVLSVCGMIIVFSMIDLIVSNFLFLARISGFQKKKETIWKMVKKIFLNSPLVVKFGTHWTTYITTIKATFFFCWNQFVCHYAMNHRLYCSSEFADDRRHVDKWSILRKTTVDRPIDRNVKLHWNHANTISIKSENSNWFEQN